jgi:hypothetical protein
MIFQQSLLVVIKFSTDINRCLKKVVKMNRKLFLNFLVIFFCCFKEIRANSIANVESENSSDVINALSANDEVVNLDRTKKAAPTPPVPSACVEFQDKAGQKYLQCEDNSPVTGQEIEIGTWYTNQNLGSSSPIQGKILNAQQNRNSQFGQQIRGQSIKLNSNQQMGNNVIRQSQPQTQTSGIERAMSSTRSGTFGINPQKYGTFDQFLQGPAPGNVGEERGFGYGSTVVPPSIPAYGPCPPQLLFSCQPTVVTVPCLSSGPSPSYGGSSYGAAQGYRRNNFNPNDDRPIRSIRYYQ